MQIGQAALPEQLWLLTRLHATSNGEDSGNTERDQNGLLSPQIEFSGSFACLQVRARGWCIEYKLTYIS